MSASGGPVHTVRATLNPKQRTMLTTFSQDAIPSHTPVHSLAKVLAHW